ncbi:hypothetical protein GW17_00027622 [Ensete ventricosum]|nr:hypothetical protein GW17_00027622 [Ensete ventricosum]RZR78795.1 hypothetical protein BHM03_00004317 [Ensete ventricosum]
MQIPMLCIYVARQLHWCDKDAERRKGRLAFALTMMQMQSDAAFPCIVVGVDIVANDADANVEHRHLRCCLTSRRCSPSSSNSHPQWRHCPSPPKT